MYGMFVMAALQVLKNHKSDSPTDLMERVDECLADGIDDVHCMLKHLKQLKHFNDTI